MNFLKISTAFLVIGSFALFYSCDADKIDEPVPSPGAYGKGIYISSEGPFQTGTGTISYLNRDTKKMDNDVFMKVNARPLGNIVQSLSIWKGRAYVVVNNASKVEVTNASTFKSVGVINGLSSPRYFVGYTAGKGYVSDWSDKVHVVNLQTNAIEKSISTGGKGPDRMLLSGNRLYVLNSGGWDVDNLLSTINTENDQLVDTLRIGDRPTGIVKDAAGMIWILCSGKGFNGWPQPGDTKAKLLKIDPSVMQIVQTLEFPSADLHPEFLVINESGNKLYYLYHGGIYELPTSSASLPSLPLIPSSVSFYALGYDPVLKQILVSDPIDFSQNGWIKRYNALNAAIIDSFQVGVIPGNFFFEN